MKLLYGQALFANFLVYARLSLNAVGALNDPVPIYTAKSQEKTFPALCGHFRRLTDNGELQKAACVKKAGKM